MEPQAPGPGPETRRERNGYHRAAGTVLALLESIRARACAGGAMQTTVAACVAAGDTSHFAEIWRSAEDALLNDANERLSSWKARSAIKEIVGAAAPTPS
jgi:hypothetical protein